MNDLDFYSQSTDHKKIILESALGNRGNCISQTSGMCGEIYIFDQGATTFPRYTCVKVPKPLRGIDNKETAKRFIRELKLQLSFYHSTFVNWAFDFHSIMGVPVASFRYWDNDLAKILEESVLNKTTKFSILTYTCVGLKHCYNKGLNSHQDLKPANIFIKNIKQNYRGLPDLDVYNFALVADFGLANTSLDFKIFDGSRPYMAPEQWNEEDLSSATDVFALGVIFYEFITNGYHPVGIKLSEFWPQPKNGNSKKWTRKEPWIKWVKSGCKIERIDDTIDSNLIEFIEKMLLINPKKRPGINDVIDFFLDCIKNESNKDYTQICYLINHFEKNLTDLKLEKKWPYLNNKWEKLETEFG